MTKIDIIQGDITQIEADAIVNPANAFLKIGGGVTGAIFNVEGQELAEECSKIISSKFPNGLSIGEAVVTKAHNLPAKIIIHTLGPRFYSENIALLSKCYQNSLKLAEENNCKSIAFPAISAGAHGLPIEKSAEIAKSALKDYSSAIIDKIVIVLYSREDYETYKKAFS